MTAHEKVRAAFHLLAGIDDEAFTAARDPRFVSQFHDLRSLVEKQADDLYDCPSLKAGRRRQVQMAIAEAAQERQQALDQVAALLRPKTRRRRGAAR